MNIYICDHQSWILDLGSCLSHIKIFHCYLSSVLGLLTGAMAAAALVFLIEGRICEVTVWYFSTEYGPMIEQYNCIS